MQMARSIMFTGKEKLELMEEPIEPPGPGQILIETTRTLVSTGTESICFTRNFAPDTHWDSWVKYPFHAGYCQAGRVIAVGEGVEDWKIGDRAASMGWHSTHITTNTEYTVRIPDHVADDEAAWMTMGKIAQVGIRNGEHKLGDDVVVIGMGLLGQLAVQYLRILGAREIIAIDTAPRRLEMASRHGATRTLQMTADKALPEVEKYTDGRRADVVYDITGHPAVLPMALPLARKFGTVVLLGDPGSPHLQHLTPDVITRGIRIIGTHAGHPHHRSHELARWSAVEILKLFMTYLARGQIQVKDMITHRYKPEEALECYTMLQRERDTAMGVIFEWK